MSGSELFFWQGIHAFEIFHSTVAAPEVIMAAIDAEVAARAAQGW